MKRFALLVASSVALLAPVAAHAQRVSPLADAPAIRKRVELRESRFEGGVGFGTTLGQDYYHSMFLNLKLDYHLNDWLSVGFVGGLGVANVETGYAHQLVDSLHPQQGPATREPTQAAALATMQKIKDMGAVQLEFTPFTGKFGMFGRVFAHYDFYAAGGFGFLVVAPTDSSMAAACSSSGNAPSCTTSGLVPGGTVSLGMHAFIKEWLALDFELRDILAKINPSGRDVNGDNVATTADRNWASTYLFAANLVVYLPSTAVISK
ncbi:MAG TPA: outer membrane beta-barrel domain-containing protein [Polyangia bacterium]|nr:outer membrane beta-barrel domain-containing protein [Polyangia bacterium]